MRPVTLVVVGLNFRAVGFVWVVDGVVKSDDFRVVRAVVVIKVVKADVEAVDAGVDDRNRDARPVVSRFLLSQIDLVHDGSVAVLNLEDTVKFQHHNARQGGGLENHGMWDSTGNSVDEREVPLVHVANLALEHRYVLLRWFVVKINDDWQGVGCVKEEFVVVVFLNHVRNFVVVAVHVCPLPPVFVGLYLTG